MTTLTLPLGITSKIESIINLSLWSKKERKDICWIKKKIVSLPKGLGGLGIQNLALIYKY